MSSIQTFSRLALKQFCALLEGVAVTESSPGDLESAIWDKIQAGKTVETVLKVPYPLIKKSLRKSKLELPYMPEIINYNIGCQALKVSGGLYLPCCGKCEEESSFCGPCAKHECKYGVLEDRGDVGTYSDPTDKHEISFGTWLAKNEKTIEEVYESLQLEGFILTIPSHHLTVNSKRMVKDLKARKGRPKAAKKEMTGDDSDSDSGSGSESEKPKKKEKKAPKKAKSPKNSDGESDGEKPKKTKAKAPKKVKSPKNSDEESDGEKPKKKEKAKKVKAEPEPEPEKKKEKKSKSPKNSDGESDGEKKSKKEKKPKGEKTETEKPKKSKSSDGESDGEKPKKEKKSKTPKAETSKAEKPKKDKSPKNSDGESDGEKSKKKKEKKLEVTDISNRFAATELVAEEYDGIGGVECSTGSTEEIFIEGTKYMLHDGQHISDCTTGAIVGEMDEHGEAVLHKSEGKEDDF